MVCSYMVIPSRLNLREGGGGVLYYNTFIQVNKKPNLGLGILDVYVNSFIRKVNNDRIIL